MASIKVHGYPISTATLRAVAVLHEKNVDFEFVFVDLKSDAHKQPHFLSLNPFGLVPAFEDGDIKIFESRAITKYIATAYESSGTPLLVQDKKQLASFATWSEVEAHQFDPAAGKLAWELYYKGLFGMEIDTAVAEENEAKLAKVLDVYEARLSQSKYLAGDSFTLVDLHHLPALHYLSGTKAKAIFDARPHVSAWVKDILGRPAWQKAVANA